jgi:hypothetical protein
MRHCPWNVCRRVCFFLLVTTLACDRSDPEPVLTTRESRLETSLAITLRARSGHYLSAETGGGAGLRASADSPGSWEIFSLVDSNGGSLESGDVVAFRSAQGKYLKADDGGLSGLWFTSDEVHDWERFRIHKLGGSGAINPGDAVGLQTFSQGAWLSAASGGGAEVHAGAKWPAEWESFTFAHYGSPWRLVWQDEFNGSEVDQGKWSAEQQKSGWVNNELQSYAGFRRENVRVENGQLIIEGRRDYHEGSEYSSARIHTRFKASWTYGRMEARMLPPAGWGTWPAFWLLPEDQSRGWPAYGEIDVMEHVGYDRNVVHATTHSTAYNWKSGVQRTARINVPGAVDGYHLYAVEWFGDRIEAYVDGVKYFTSVNNGQGENHWPFNKPFHLIFNLAIGGDWGGAQGVDPNVWPQQLKVDYVRVYQH